MARSILSTKFNMYTMVQFERQFRERYKKDNGEPFNGSVLREVTLGVIEKKGIPDADDVITLIIPGNNNCKPEQACDILTRWLEVEDNKDRGITGAFCEICKDLFNDIPVNEIMKGQINNLEDTIIKSQEARVKLNDMMDNLKNILSNLNINNIKEHEQEVIEDKHEVIEDKQEVDDKKEVDTLD